MTSAQMKHAIAATLFLVGCTAMVAGQTPAPKADDKAKTEDKAKADEKKADSGAETDEQAAARAFQEGKFDDAALKRLKSAVDANPKLGTVRTVLARWLIESRKAQEGRTMLEQAAAEAPRHPVIYLLNANIAILDNRITEAILSLDRVQELADRNWPANLRSYFNDEARSGLALAYEKRGDWNQVKRYLLEFLKDNPDNAAMLQRLARANFLLGSDAEAAENLKQAFKQNPTLDPPELSLAQLWATKGTPETEAAKIKTEIDKNKQKAQEWFDQALAKYDANKALTANSKEAKELAAKVYRGYADWLLTQGNMTAAKTQIDTAAKLEPDSRETLAVQGMYHRYKGDFAQAAKFFEQAWSKSPSFAIAIANLALTLVESADAKDRKRALEFAEQFYKQNPQNAEAFAVLGYCMLKQDDPKLTDVDQVLSVPLRTGQVTPDTAYFVACLFKKRAQWTEAEAILKKALDANPVFVYRAEAQKLYEEAKAKAPPKKDEKPKESKEPTPSKK